MKWARDASGRFLRWVGRYTKTDMVYLTSGAFWLGVDQAINGLFAFGLTIAFAYFVPKEDYGTYRFLTAGLWLLTAFTMTGLSTAMSQAVARGKDAAYLASFKTSMLWGIPMAVIAFCVSAYYFFAGNSELGIGFLIVALLGPFLQSAYLWGSYFLGKKSFISIALWGTPFALIPAAALLGTMFFTDDPIIFFATYLLSTILTGLALGWVAQKRIPPNNEADHGFKNLGAHFSVMNLLSTAAAQIDKLAVFHYLGAVELAVYSLATGLPDHIKNVFSGVSSVALPKFVSRPLNEIRANFWYRIILFTVFSGGIAGVYALIAPYLYQWFFPAYGEAIIYSQIYALSLVLMGNTLPITLLQAHEAKRELYIFNIVTPIVQIASLVFFTAWFGLIGTISARIAARAWSMVFGGVLVEVYAARTKNS